MKILVIHNQANSYGGGFLLIENISKELRKTGNKVVCLDLLKDLKVPYSIKFSPLDFNYSKYLEIRRSVKKHKPDIIHFYCNFYDLTLLLATRGYKKILTVQGYHSIFPNFYSLSENLGYPENITQNFLELIKRKATFKNYLAIRFHHQLMKYQSATVICPSKQLLEVCKNIGFIRARYVPVVTDFSVLDSPPRGNAILCVAELVGYKGVLKLLNIFSQCLKKQPKLKLILIGDGPLRPQVEQRIKDLNLTQSVDFIPKVIHRQMSDYYSKCFAVSIPTLTYETGPLVALEAMACGRPIVAFNRGGTSEIVKDSKTGFLIEGLNENDFTTKLLKLHTEPDLAHKLGLNGQKHLLEKYNNKKWCEALLEIYAV